MYKLIIPLLFILLSGFSHAQDKFENCEKPKALYDVLKKEHYAPKTLDDRLSEQVFDKFIGFLDKEGVLFLKTDIDSLEFYRNRLDNEISDESCDFLNKISDLFYKRLFQADSIISVLSDQVLNLKKDEELALKKEDIYELNESDLKEKWRKILKYEVLNELYDIKGTDSNKLSTEELLLKAESVREIVCSREHRRIKRILDHPNGFSKYISYIYLNSIAMCFDPHSMYISMNELKSLESDLSDESLSFGIELGEDKDGNIQILRLTPGGPAWKTNMLNKGDILLKMKWENSEEIDLKYADIYEISYDISNVNDKSLELTVRKLNGNEVTVKLVKEKIQADDNIVKSFVLDGDKKVGYITLPSFYTEWENEKVLGCANDVAKEILKLQKENIEGLIFDLRDNGGGAMNEAIGLAGIFIDAGPLAIYHMTGGKPRSLKDINRGTVYDGPLVILVNGQSASASEILAAAMQDLNRAIIVGSKTFGKSTGQAIMPMDTSFNVFTSNMMPRSKFDDFIKVTDMRFYRIPGSTYQKKGVIPDIDLPVLKTGYEFSEADYDYAFQNDSIIKKMYYTPFPDLPLAELKSKSTTRIKTNHYFQTINIINDVIKNKNHETFSLNIEDFLKDNESYDSILDQYEKHEVNDSLYNVTTSKFDTDIYKMDDYRDEIRNNFIKQVASDPYIQEAFQIICDIFNE